MPTFGPVVELSSLNGSNGFQINGEAASNQSGYFVSSAGDVNGDGVGDLVIGAPGAGPNGFASGATYVVFGSSAPGAFGPTLEPSSLNGSNGFQINGETELDLSGWSVSSAGDVNGDGVDDLIIAAYGADPNGPNSGASYVVFGRASGFGPTLELSGLNGSNGFQINGEAAGDQISMSVSSAGDINDDGLDDLIIGASQTSPNGTTLAGTSYVVFGRTSGFGPTLELSSLNGSNGFQINGEAAGDASGHSVSSAGDVNGDGTDDLLIGAVGADPNGPNSGASYVVFGSSAPGAFGAELNLSGLNGSNGFQINGETENDTSGYSVSAAGDVNGDGTDDLLIGAVGAGPSRPNSGVSYVVFGRTSGFGPTLELSSLNGSNGFQINGETAGDLSGFSVSSAGDVNGDGVGDLIIGAPTADPNGPSSGASYVVFGVALQADLSIAVTSADTSPVQPGDTLTYTITVTNSGPDAAQNVSVTDVLPASVRFQSLSAPAGFTTTTPAVGVSGTIMATAASLAGGASAVFTLAVTVSPNAADGTQVSNTASVTSSTADPDGTDTSGTAPALLVAAPDPPSGIAVEGGGELAAAEFAAAGTQVGRLIASDPDSASVTYSLVEDAGGRFVIDPSSGWITVAKGLLLDFEQAQSHTIRVRAADPDGLFLERTFTVGVRNVDPEDITADTDANTLVGGDLSDTLRGGAGADALAGGRGRDLLAGSLGADLLEGGRGPDRVTGGIGHDRLWGGSGGDRLQGQIGRDGLFGDQGRDWLWGGAGEDRLVGGTERDRLWGGGGDDRLVGGNGHDRLWGGEGDDHLEGGLGRDILVGGRGTDTFAFNQVEDDAAGTRRDVIRGFRSGEDEIRLRAIDADESVRGNQNFSWVDKEDLSARFTGAAGELRFAGGVLMGDVDGDGRADFRIKVVGHLDPGDLVM